MKTAFLFAAGLIATSAYARPLMLAKVPIRADAPVLFAPIGWKIEKRVNGDLNHDKVADAVLVLVEDKPAKDKSGDPTERERALIVLLKTGKGWTRVGMNNSLLLGTRDGGAFFGVVETPVDVNIVKGIITVDEENGSREITDTAHKFRYDAVPQSVYLIGMNQSDRDRLTGGSTSTSINYLTGHKIVTTFKSDSSQGKVIKSKVHRVLRTMESVKVDERYSG